MDGGERGGHGLCCRSALSVLGKSLDLLFLRFREFKDVQTYHRTWVLQELINYHLYGLEDL